MAVFGLAGPIFVSVFLGTWALAPYTARPFVKIEASSCPTKWTIWLYIAMVITICVGWAVRDQNAAGKEAVWISGIWARLLLVFTVIHPLCLVLPRLFGRTISKWPGLLCCEAAKSTFIAMCVVVFTDDYSYGGAFMGAVAAAFVITISVTCVRIYAVIKVCSSEEGFSMLNFDTYYYGTSRECPFSPAMLGCERNRAPELLKDSDEVELANAS